MQTLQKAGAYALIFGVKCLRQALCTLADFQDGVQPARPAPAAEIRALRNEVDAMHASLRQIKATLNDGLRAPSDDQLLQ